MHPSARLKRSLGLALVTFYGLGTIVGAGIYVLVGEVARVSGEDLPWAFLLAGVIAGLTGACYADLCGRFPRAAGAALYVDRAFGRPGLSLLTGALILATGIISAAAISRGFVGYLNLYIALPDTVAIIGLCLVMGLVTSVGIRESAWVISAITLLEVSGLLLVAGLTGNGEPRSLSLDLAPGPVMLGAFLAFYAYIGFEDMVNLAEEVVEPRRVLPRAVLLAIGLSSLLYMMVSIAAVRHVDLQGLADSSSPLALMIGNHEAAARVLGMIGVIAVSNGALTQIITGSRLLYGLARRRLLPRLFGSVHPRTRTPLLSTWLVVIAIASLAVFLPVATLARITSAIMLVIFMLVNLSLIRVQRRAGPVVGFRVWTWVPWLSLALNTALLAYQLAGWSG